MRSSPLADCLLLLALGLLLHLALLPRLAAHLPFSAYWRRPRAALGSRDSALRLAAATYLASMPGQKPVGWVGDMAVVVLTAPRQGHPGYLARTLAALHSQMAGGARPVLVCTGEGEGGHPELEQLKHPFPVLRPPGNATQVAPLSSGNHKHKADFSLCCSLIEDELPPSVEYVLLLEDDVLLMDGFFPILLAWLSLHREALAEHPWLDIKLYLSPRLRGFAWDALPLAELLVTSATLALVLEAVVRWWRPGSWLRTMVAWGLALALLLALSRQHSMQWRRLHPHLYLRREAPSFGTPAVLYQRSELARAGAFLAATGLWQDAASDLTLSRYRRQAGLRGWLVEPSLVRHIGRTSSFDLVHEAERDAGDLREYYAPFSI
jgi:hypothetical protein